MVSTVRTIRLRVLIGVLIDRGFSIFRIAEDAAVPILELRRLQEFGSMPEPITAERLIHFSEQALNGVSTPPKPVMQVTVGHIRAARRMSRMMVSA